MTHAFLLFVYLGVGAEKNLVSNDMYFYDIDRCNYFASRITREYGNSYYYQGSNITAYCLPKLVGKDVRIYE
jgi:hypothetical protein